VGKIKECAEDLHRGGRIGGSIFKSRAESKRTDPGRRLEERCNAPELKRVFHRGKVQTGVRKVRGEFLDDILGIEGILNLAFEEQRVKSRGCGERGGR